MALSPLIPGEVTARKPRRVAPGGERHGPRRPPILEAVPERHRLRRTLFGRAPPIHARGGIQPDEEPRGSPAGKA